MDPESLLKNYLSATQEGLDADDIDALMDDYRYDEDIDDESHIKRVKITTKKAVAEARKFFNTQKETRVIHNPSTGKIKKMHPLDKTPNGWVDGGVKGKFSYGPLKGQTKVYHNGSKKIYVKHGEVVPDGFVPGVHYEGITKGRIGCHNPITLEKRYLRKGEIFPDGFVVGLIPTTGKKLSSPHGVFNSVAQCIAVTKLTRYAIECKIKQDAKWFYIKD
jgi:hypothetical protein